MHMKSILAISFLTASTCYSVIAQADSSSNFLAGFEGVYARQKENFTTSFIDPSLTTVAITATNEQSYMLDDDLVMAGGILGWQWRCNKYLVGFEANLDLHSMNKARSFVYNGGASVFEGTAEYDRGPIYGFTARLGYLLTPSMMPYIRGGAQFSRDEGTYQVFTNVGGAAQQADFISTGKQDIWGYILGIGIEVPGMIGPSTIRVEYVYSRSGSLSFADSIPPIFADNRFEHPQINAIKFAWIWNFVPCNNKTASVAVINVPSDTTTNGSSDTASSDTDSSTSSDDSKASDDSKSSDAKTSDDSKSTDAKTSDDSKSSSTKASDDSKASSSDSSSAKDSQTKADSEKTSK